MWDTVKAALRGKFLALNAYTRKEKMSHINNLSTYLKNLEKEKQNKLKVSRRKEKIKRRIHKTANINPREMKQKKFVL